MGASVLRNMGFEEFYNVLVGMKASRELEYPTEASSPTVKGPSDTAR